MDKIAIGKLIKERRKELGINQQTLCIGICNRSALSRIENGEPNVGIDIICQLFDRLGLSSEVIYATEDNYDNRIRQVIRNANQADVTGNRVEALRLLDTIAADYDSFSLQNKQRYDVINTMLLYEDGRINIETKIGNLEKSMKLTRPDYCLEKFPLVMTDMEAQILRYIASSYAILGEHEIAISLYYHLKRCAENDTNRVKSANRLVSICYNLSKCLGVTEKFSESIAIAEEGIDVCNFVNDMAMLPLCMYNCAWSLTYRNENGDREEAKRLLDELSKYCTPQTPYIDEFRIKIDELRRVLYD
ncbi:MAG: helix-turn-helix domain-containing protein [Oscillospiraceae bacterium]|nr:helix-turn-helix domain-containing protein [Oscillospiraceae bacterium]